MPWSISALRDILQLDDHRNQSYQADRLQDDPEVVVVNWDGPDDPLDPFNWSLRRKWWAVGLGLFASFISSMNGTIISVAYQAINEEFQVSDAAFPNSYWPITSWGMGGALFPLILFPAMEDYGIRPVFLIIYFLFICLLIPIGLAPNFATLIVPRFFTGGCVQIQANAVGAIISNVFPDDRARSVPIALYITVYLAATSMGPVIGASILEHLSWRWIGYIELIWTAACFPIFIIALPEARGTVLLRAKAKKLRREGKKAYTEEEMSHESLRRIIAQSLQRPLYMLCKESVVFVATIWTAFSLGTIYLFTQSVGQVYQAAYGWGPVQAGYVQVAIVVGEIIGCGLCAYTNQWYYDSASWNTEAPGVPLPEARLYASIIGGFFGVTGGMFVYGWTSYLAFHWIAPTVGLAMVGFGTCAVVVSIVNYLIDAYSKYAASALAAVGLIENTTVAFLPFAAGALYTNLGFQWASSLLAFVSLGLVATPFAVLRWGKEVRNRSPFMKEAMFDRQREGQATSSHA